MGATYTGSCPTNLKDESFTYDPVGNRLISTPNRTYTYNAGDELTSYKGKAYSYDNNGNLIRKTDDDVDVDLELEGWTYYYDYDNRLVRAVKSEKNEVKTITFKYDPFGRRVEKRVEEIEGGTAETKTYNYVYDNEDVILEYQTKSDGKVETTEYTHGPGIDEPLAIERKGEVYYYHADGLGSITALTDSNQKTVESYTYSAFGELKRKGDKVKNTYTYTGREWDEETGLYYYRARYYDASAGRFISKDPIGFAGGDVNLYNYVRNNPVNGVDPWGLWTYATEYGTTGVGLTSNMTSIENTVDSVFNAIANRDAVVTYTTNGTHSANSLHYSGNAIDLRTRDITPSQIQDATTRLRNALGSNYDVINEGNHIHIEYDPPCRL